MGIVKISDLLHDDIRDASKAMSRSVNAQAEYWIRLGMMSELYPELKEGANKRGNSSRLTQSFHFFMFEPIFSPVNALNQPI
ncbi:ParD-like family protein [Raoultella ornithinolytica]|uniref:ParD-like family protein n=1 Tax=Raoultella ornithinolytica TaxID=54291 RepID=UPI0010065896|nr:hypothetical protein DN602_22035 [Raoultella ornithinolytica]